MLVEQVLQVLVGLEAVAAEYQVVAVGLLQLVLVLALLVSHKLLVLGLQELHLNIEL